MPAVPTPPASRRPIQVRRPDPSWPPAIPAAPARRQSVPQLVLAKPQGSRPSLVLVRFAAVWLSLAALAAIMLAAASLAQVAVGGTPWHLSPYVHALAHT